MSAFDHSPSLSSYQTSPMEDYLSFDDPYNGPLFPDANVDTSPASFHTKSFPNNVSYAAAPLTRNKSSPGQSPGTAHGRHSSVSGVNSRRSGKALGPVSCDKTDPVSVKRARNTEAARKSRARKLERVENLEETIEGLKAQLEQTAAERDYYRQLAQGRSS
jgi:general control protein GCN4